MILMPGGFHLCHNYAKSITRVIWNKGQKMCWFQASNTVLTGTTNNIFNAKCDYHQTLYALTLLCEIMIRLHGEAFEECDITKNRDMTCLIKLNERLPDLSSAAGYPKNKDYSYFSGKRQATAVAYGSVARYRHT